MGALEDSLLSSSCFKTSNSSIKFTPPPIPEPETVSVQSTVLAAEEEMHLGTEIPVLLLGKDTFRKQREEIDFEQKITEKEICLLWLGFLQRMEEKVRLEFKGENMKADDMLLPQDVNVMNLIVQLLPFVSFFHYPEAGLEEGENIRVSTVG